MSTGIALHRADGRREKLYLRHAGEATRLAYLLTGDEERAARIATGALARLFSLRYDLRPPDVFEAALYTRVAKLAGRQRARRDDSEAGGGPTWAALRSLPRTARAVLVLRSWLGLSEDEIAHVLSCSPGKVRRASAEAAAALERQLGARTPGGLDAEVTAGLEAAAAALRGGPAPYREVAAAARRRLVARAAAVVAAIALAASVAAGLPGSAGRTTAERAKEASEPLRRIKLPGGFPAKGPKVEVASSQAGALSWSVVAYESVKDDLCLRLDAGRQYRDRHCISPTEDLVRAFVEPDRFDHTTFLYGKVVGQVESLELKLGGAPPVPLPLFPVPDEAGLDVPVAVYVETLPGYLHEVGSKETARYLGYQSVEAELIARDASGRLLERLPLILGAE